MEPAAYTYTAKEFSASTYARSVSARVVDPTSPEASITDNAKEFKSSKATEVAILITKFFFGLGFAIEAIYKRFHLENIEEKSKKSELSADFMLHAGNSVVQAVAGTNLKKVEFKTEKFGKVILRDVSANVIDRYKDRKLYNLEKVCPGLMHTLEVLFKKNGKTFGELERTNLNSKTINEIINDYAGDEGLEKALCVAFSKGHAAMVDEAITLIFGATVEDVHRCILADIRLDKDKTNERKNGYQSCYNLNGLHSEYNKALVTQNLEKIGTAGFVDIDLDNFKNLFDIKSLPDNITVSAFQKEAAKLTPDEIEFLANMRVGDHNADKSNWKPNNDTKLLLHMLGSNHSDRLNNLYKCIFPPDFEKKYCDFLEVKQTLERIGTDKFGPDDLKVFKHTFGLDDSLNLTVDMFQKAKATRLNKKEIKFLLETTANLKKDEKWVDDREKHFTQMLNFGRSDGLRDICEHLFTKDHAKKYEMFFNTKQVLEKIGKKSVGTQCTQIFSDSDLTSFISIYQVSDSRLTVATLKNMPELTNEEVRFFADMRINDLVHGRTWEVDKTTERYFSETLSKVRSTELSSLCRFIFSTKNCNLLFETKQVLEKVGKKDFTPQDLARFNAIYNLNLTGDQVRTIPRLTNEEVLLLARMRADPVNGDGWKRDNTNHFLKMLDFGLSDGVCAVYKHIYTPETMRKVVELANDIQYHKVVFASNSDDDHGEMKFSFDSSPAIIRNYGADTSASRYMEITLNQQKEKLFGMTCGQLRGKIYFDKLKHRDNYTKFDPNHVTKFQQNFATRVNEALSGYLPFFNILSRTHDVQGAADWIRATAYSIAVQAKEASATATQEAITYKDLVRKQEAQVNDETTQNCLVLTQTGYSKLVSNTIILLADQHYRSILANPLPSVMGQMGCGDTIAAGDDDSSLDKTEYENCVITIPNDFETKGELLFKGTVFVKNTPIDYEAKLTFSNDFLKKIENGSVLTSNEFGVEAITFEKLIVKDPIKV